MKKKRNNRSKRLIAILLMLSIVLSTGTFAFWATSVEGTKSEAIGTLTIGYAESVETVFELTNTLQDGGLLVPGGHSINSGDQAVEVINLSYNLLWKEDTIQTQLDGITAIGEISVSHSFIIESDGTVLDSTKYSEIYDLIHINYDTNNPTYLTLDGKTESFAFTVTMDEPSNQKEYDLISNSNISVVFYYKILDNFIETTNDVNGPYLTLVGDDTVYVELSDSYIDQGVIAYNSIGEEVSNTWNNSDVNTWQIGSYTIQYSGYSSYDNQSIPSIERTVVVVDTTAPVVSISGNSTITLSVGDSYSDWGAWANDASNTQSAITRVGTVDTSVAGTYLVTYYSTDASGNTGQAVKTIIVNEK